MTRSGRAAGGAVVAGASASQWRDTDPWTVLRLILWSSDYLTEKGVRSGRLDAEHLLAHVLGTGRLQLYLEFERPLTPSERDAFRPLLKRRASREPLQYIVGHQPFRELDLKVAPGVLIPRSETEQLVERVLAWTRAESLRAPSVLDIGTGSGAIALSLASEGNAVVVATDVSEVALELAGENRDAAGLNETVALRRGALFEPVRGDALFDVVVSNPPYIADVDAVELDPEVRDWEPREALFAGADGLDVIREVVRGAGRHLRVGGLLALEVGFGQAEIVARLLEQETRYSDIRIERDLDGVERFVLAHCAAGNDRASDEAASPTGER